MPVIHFPDSGGHTLKLVQYGEQGYLSNSVFPQNILEDIHNVHIRDDDVLLCSYPKSGCHWLWEISRMLRAGTTSMQVVEKEQYMMEDRSQSHLFQLPSPRILNTHVRFQQLPQRVQDGKVKIIFIYRNPKDVAVSFYHHHTKFPSFEYSGEFANYLSGLFLTGHIEAGDFFTYHNDWEKVMKGQPDLPIFVISYEELQADTFSKAKELAKFLKVSVDDATIHDIADTCSFGKMRERKGNTYTSKRGASVIYRKGKVGDWKNWFTVAQSEMMDQICEKKMKESRFQFQYTL